jgi:CMP-N-acetylneuraminic acid synthetase
MVLGVIPARGGSKGLPGKNLRYLGGVPLIVHTIRAAQESRLLTDYLVSTDDPTIAEVAKTAGAKVPFIRPAELASDEMSVWPAIRHAVEHWERHELHSVEAVAVLQPTSPLRTGGDIDACISRFREIDAEICATVVATHDSPYFNMVEVPPGSAPFIRPCSPLMHSSSRRQDAPQVYALNGAVYVVRRSILTTLDNQFQVDRFAIFEMPRDRSVDIDTEDDLELAEWLLARGATQPMI